MDDFKNSTYIYLKREFEEYLNRKLKKREKDFLKWLAKQYLKEKEKDIER